MGRTPPLTLLIVLVAVVPLGVGVAGLASFLLLRAGYGILVWAGLPFLVLILAAAGLGILLGRTASRRRGEPEDRSRDKDNV